MYLTVKHAGVHEIVVNKSRFICSLARVQTQEEAIAYIKKIKKDYHNATHNPYAYIIGENKTVQKANDDKEPSGTAGVPILEILKKNSLTDIICVVTRYFGGVKLGAGGLIRAYAQAAAETIKKTGIIKKQEMYQIIVEFPYSLVSVFENKLRDYYVNEKLFLEQVQYIFRVETDRLQLFIDYIVELSGNNIKYKLGDKIFSEIDYIPE